MEKKNEIAKQNQKVTDLVLARVTELSREKSINLPSDYSPGNAIKAAELILSETKDKNGKSVLETCTKASIANSLFEMVIMGLSPARKQSYFIAYGNKLTHLPSYHGRIAMARRVGLKNIHANVVYEGDDFAYKTDPMTGRIAITKHEQEISNIDINKIKAAYAVYEINDGIFNAVIMTIQQIKKAWMQGATKGESPAHKGFAEEMSKKSVIGRACKNIVNTSIDSYLFDEGDAEVQGASKPSANATSLDFDDAEIVEYDPKEKDNKESAARKAEINKSDEGMDQAALEFEKEEMEKAQKAAAENKPNF